MSSEVLKGNIGNRMDRLPISSVHYRVLFALAIAYFFEFSDLNTFSYAAPAMIKAWHLSVQTIAFITSSSFVGMFIGAYAGGWVADKIGRKRAIIYSLISLSVFSLLNAFSWDISSFMIIRLITGAATSALLVNANTYISEFFPSAIRGRYQAYANAIGISGIPITGFISGYLVTMAPWGWRLIFAWGALGIIALFFFGGLVEIPRWYLAHGEPDKAESIMRKIEDEVAKEKGPLPEPAPFVERATIKKTVGFTEMFKGEYAGRTTLLAVAWIFQTLAFYGFGSWVPTLLVKQGINLNKSIIYTSLMALGAPIGSFVGSIVADRFERKWNLIVTSVFIAIAVFLYGATMIPVFMIISGIFINLIERTFSTNLYSYTSELYPTEVRATGQGLTYGLGRLSNMAGPLMISFLFTGYGYFSVFLFIAVMWMLTAVAIGFGPRTSKRSLEELNKGIPSHSASM